MRNKMLLQKAIDTLPKTLIMGEMADGRGGVCAGGHLALVAGITEDELLEFETYSFGHSYRTEITSRISKEYGMDWGDISEIVSTNDSFEESTRKARVLALLHTMIGEDNA